MVMDMTGGMVASCDVYVLEAFDPNGKLHYIYTSSRYGITRPRRFQ